MTKQTLCMALWLYAAMHAEVQTNRDWPNDLEVETTISSQSTKSGHQEGV